MKKIHCNTSHRVLGLLMLAGGMFSGNAAGALGECRNLVYNLSYTKDINLVGKKVGDTIGVITITGSGECWKSMNGVFNVAVYSKAPEIQSISGDTNGSYGLDAYDKTGVISITNGSNGLYLMQLMVGNNSSAPVGWVRMTTPVQQPIILRKKIVGKIDIPISQFYRNTDFYMRDYINGGVFKAFPISGVTGTGDFGSNITLTYTPTCSASVDDVPFPGAPTASAIVARSVTPRTATVRVECDDILPKYTVKVSSPKGTHNASDGIIRSDNATVGYQLTWDNGQVAAAGSNVQLDSVLTPATLPSASTFTLPINVRPVGLVPQDDITAGQANSAIRVDLTFN